jgi:hypothetical protein
MTEAVAPWRRLWNGWLAIAARFGSVQTLLLVALFYAILIGPMGLGAAIARRDFLGRRGLREPGSAWREADSAKPDLERAKLLS